MRPLTLHLQYFGPYRDETIDFTKFEATPLFLISGKTGSGKTTIFDGMCYALFDQSSGVDREPQAMRSDFATTQDRTRVTFEFSHRDRRYRIVREPAQMQHKKRGTGLTKLAAKVELTVFEGATEVDQLTKSRQVDDYLQNLLQMDGKQFAQIVLLPQGEFRRFLTAPSEDKATVLEQLFNTEIFAQWTDRLRAKLRQDQAQNEDVAQQLQRLEQDLIWTADNQESVQELMTAQQVTELLALMTTQQATTQDLVTAIAAQLKTAQQRVTALTQQDTREDQLLQDRQQLAVQVERQQRLAEQLPQMTTLQQTIKQLEWVQTIQPQWQERTVAQHELKQRQATVQQAQERLAVAQQAQQAAVKQQKDSATIDQRIATTKDELAQQAKVKPIYQQIAELTRQLKVAQQQVTTAQQAVQAAQTTLTQSQHAQQNLQQIVDQQTTVYQASQSLTKQEAQLTDWQRQLRTLQDGDQREQFLQQQVTTLQAQLKAQQGQAQQAQQQAEALNQELLNHEIVRLVGQLKPGSPCPICGATDHPAPAAVADTTVTEAEVKQAQAVAQRQQDQAAQLSARLTSSQQSLTDQQQKQQAGLKQLASDLSVSLNVDNALAELTQQFSKLVAQNQRAMQENQYQLAEIKTAQEQLTKLAQQAQQQTQQLQRAQADHQDKTRAVDRLAAQLTTQQQQLPEQAATLAEFQAQEQTLRQRLATDQATWDAITERVTKATNQVTIATTEVKAATSEVTKSQQRVTTTADQVATLLAEHFDQVTPTIEADVAQQLEQIALLPTQRARLHDFQTQRERVATTIAELKKRVADRPTPDREQTQAALQAATKQVNELLDQRHTYQDQWQRNSEVMTKLNQLIAQQAVALKQTQELTELVGVVNGDGPNSKLGLERYVLQTYLRQILTVGNQRLQQLTNGRYQFLVDEQPATYKKNSGLEINVYDDHVGEQRSVHTLSGGESFIAALALALALGEVIQQTTGSVDVDALFIDEGFGSLDEDALMTALESLETVEGRHRMIGIISHVSELRAQVPNQLQVVSNGNGESSITYQIDES
ncbi:AAA family ATPase [Levilactobacillus tujiorum]|uniref:Nuclease SbcCD subunit C n=1 Tax=Levilactobacillus tujiorum TaxID=2912243 RepID=A0ABX1L3M6_9LACO|nr:SMC family ATPase [Levilactobacillus tujiorum]MCH5464617.1 SMC family ATPase [Levilactobacillus tujiorum]NLR11701.1 SMC family ATPase [Lactobacillus sp. HBUAS51387]NLR29622.1 SMC family ATPase [Levilactobacillus tujiorum]